MVKLPNTEMSRNVFGYGQWIGRLMPKWVSDLNMMLNYCVYIMVYPDLIMKN